MSEHTWKELLNQKGFAQDVMPYALKIENISAYLQECSFCETSSCRTNCPMPYTDSLTVLDLLHKIGVEDNVSQYAGRRNGGRKDLILNIVWQKDFDYEIQKFLSGVDKLDRVNKNGDGHETEKEEPSIDNCFNEFRKPEILDEDNKWYCNKCKDHVQATKQLEIFRCPPILLINLKRFRQSKSTRSYMGMFGGSAHSQKIESEVDFPLDGLDMRQYIMGNQKNENLIYDCYAVSNHYGNIGFGHYTAYAKNPITNKWYDFDDSRVSEISPHKVKEHVCSSAAYTLFYRRRDWHEKNVKEGLNYEDIALKPDLTYV